MQPKGLLFDYGGTLVEEVSVDLPAGNAWLFERASYVPPGVTLEHVLERASIVIREVVARRDQVQIETPWPTLTRLIHDFLGIRFSDPIAELEMGFWKASVQTRAIPDVRDALQQFNRLRIPMAVVSNTSFSEPIIRYELTKHGLADHLAFVMVSAEYSVRKPHVRLFDTAAARLGVVPTDIWFVGDRLDTDITGARTAGMTPVWFNRHALNDPRADLTVSTWNDLAHHVLEGIEPA